MGGHAVAGSAKRFCVLKFCCVQKTFHRIYFKHIVKAKVFSPKIYFSPKLYNMATGLVALERHAFCSNIQSRFT